MISNRRIYLTEDGEAVEDGDPRSHSLLVGAGCQIHDTLVKKHGLVFPEPKPAPKPLTESELVAFRVELDARAADIARRQAELAQMQSDFRTEQEAFAQEKEEFAMTQHAAQTNPAADTQATQTKATAPADDKAVKAAPENKAVAGPAETK